MAWNQTTSYSKKRSLRKGGKGMLYCVLFAAIIVSICIGLITFNTNPPKADVNRTDAPRKAKIVDVKQTIHKGRSKQVDVQLASKGEEPNPLPPQRVGELRDGYRLLPSGRMHKVLGTITAKDTTNEWLEKAFPEPSDQLIAGLITIEPGESLIGDSEGYYRNFAEQFQTSLLSPIRIEKDDNQYIRELKEAVKATRGELVTRLKAGEDIAQVMVNTRKQYQELGLYRNELRDLVRKNLADGEMSATDYEDLVKAANVMLEERGSKPLDLPETFKKYIDIMGIGDETEADYE